MSDKPLAERLQVKGARRLATLHAPAGLSLDTPNGPAPLDEADVVLLFTPDRAALDAALPGVLEGARRDAILWIAYPKLTSKRARDLNRDVIHALAPSFGLDTVAQIAVDADWSALRMKRLD